MKTTKERFNDLKDVYVSNFQRTNGEHTNASVEYKDGFVLVTVTLPTSSGTGKHRISEFEKMTKSLESRPDYSKPKTPAKKVIEGKIDKENTDTEDGGQALITTIDFRDTPEEEDNGVFVRIQSWDENCKHEEFKKFEGHKIRITIETID